MQKKFSFSILFLLLIATVGSFASGKTQSGVPLKSSTAEGLAEPEFSSVDGSNDVWYYIRFGRQANNNLVWTTDYTSDPNSWSIKQLAKKDVDKYDQHWKLVGDIDAFYIENRATGYKVAYAATEVAEKGIRGGNYIVDPNGSSTTLRLASSKGNSWDWTGALDWVIINPTLGATSFMNDRAKNDAYPWRDVCNYGFADDGFRVQFIYAEKQTIVVAVDSVSMETFSGYTKKTVFSGISSFNLETAGINATIEGADAQYFGIEGATTLPGAGELTLTFTPSEKRKYSANLVLSGGTAEPVIVRLSGNAIDETDLPLISSEDNSDEHWYYIQFYRRASSNLVWALSDTTRMLIQDTLKANALRDDMEWKICGDWANGFYLVNKVGKYGGKEITYCPADSVIDGSSVPGNRYIVRTGGYGDTFEFIRFGATSDWQFYNADYAKYINDYQGKFICNYSKDDSGNRLVFIAADKPAITASVSSLALEVPARETVTATINVMALRTTGNINAVISGADASVFSVSPASLPSEGGELTVTFSPTEAKNYAATLTLSSAGADDITVALTGNSALGLPLFSTDDNEIWYYIQFNRKSSLAWTAEDIDGKIMQRDKIVIDENEEDEDVKTSAYKQQWKFVGDWTNGYQIINRTGGAALFDTVSVSATTSYLVLVEEAAFGDKFLFKRQNANSKWQLKIIGKDDGDAAYAYLNDYGGANGDGSIGLYIVDDSGNLLIFTAVDPATGIQNPALDEANGTIIATKYYTLQGVEVNRPTATGIYIVRNIYSSGKVNAVKTLYILK
ncbi:MAG: hypothetical protein LBH32_05265 [Dysgonamonadaceae bacterium]|nr:hypothetical protein [Dysgonamonadaceae bacterium]